MSKVKFPVSTAAELADAVVFAMDKNKALTAITDGTVGISTRNVRGYTRTSIGLAEYNYDRLQELCDEANAILFPNRTPRESYEIVLSSMRKV